MIANPRQVFDERRNARQGPEGGLVTVCGGASEQRSGDLLGLLRRKLGFAARRPLARQRGTPALIPRILPAVSDLPGDTETAGYFRCRIISGEQFAGLLTALFHPGMVACLRHAKNDTKKPDKCHRIMRDSII